jgi:hypothetical protein
MILHHSGAEHAEVTQRRNGAGRARQRGKE